MVIPLPSWVEHELTPNLDNVVLTKQITILQTGQGNDARELRIIGTNTDGIPGMYVKRIADKNWLFAPIATVDVLGVLPFEEISEGVVQPAVYDWASKDALQGLANYGPYTVDAILNITVDGEQVSCLLHARDNLILGSLKCPCAIHYDLVKPADSNEQIDRMFNGKPSIPVDITISKDGTCLTIKSRFCSGPYIRYDLQRLPTKV
jgi:hypothetical protein